MMRLVKSDVLLLLPVHTTTTTTIVSIIIIICSILLSINVQVVQSFQVQAPVIISNKHNYNNQQNNQQQQNKRNSILLQLHSTIVPNKEDTTTSSTTSSKNNNNNNNNNWFHTRIQDAINYDDAVQRLYVRHIVTQTKEMAELVEQQYISTSSSSTSGSTTTTTTSMDPFADIAQTVSSCTYTRTDGGKIGWIERTDELQSILSNSVIQQLYKLRPKPGDVYIIGTKPTSTSTTGISIDSEETADTSSSNIPEQYHVIQVTEVWLNSDYILLGNSGNISRKRPINRKDSKVVDSTTTTSDNNYSLKTYNIQTAGCQMNVADSERLEGILQNELNIQPILLSDDYNRMNPIDTDLLLFNTCSIRDQAEQKLYNALKPYTLEQRTRYINKDNNKDNNNNNNKKVLKRKPTIIVTGCVAQQEGDALIQRIPDIDAVIGPQYIPYLANILEHITNGGNQLVLTAPLLIQQENYRTTTSTSTSTASSTMTLNDNNNNSIDNDIINYDKAFYTKPVRGHDIRAWVNVIHGCNEHCTYCVVPNTRGIEQSRTMEAILDECIQLANDGYKEITLLGQNIDAYGRDMVPKRTFAQLLYYINDNLQNTTIDRIRYVTSHPRYFSDRVIDAVATLNKVCECFHMPFQAGNSIVLKNMRRGYTYESYLKIIERIRTIAGIDAAITTDIIVGFPGETEEQFQDTLKLMNAVKFDMVYSFVYSPRPNTEASTYDDPISYEIKAERLQRVQALAAQHALERGNRYLHRTIDVLIEDVNPKNPKEQVMGRTRQGRPVYFNGSLQELRGRIVNVTITEARTWSLMGIMV